MARQLRRRPKSCTGRRHSAKEGRGKCARRGLASERRRRREHAQAREGEYSPAAKEAGEGERAGGRVVSAGPGSSGAGAAGAKYEQSALPPLAIKGPRRPAAPGPAGAPSVSPRACNNGTFFAPHPSPVPCLMFMTVNGAPNEPISVIPIFLFSPDSGA